jgi:hypothetical protein
MRTVIEEQSMERETRPPSLLDDSIRAHTLRFGTPLAPAYGDAAGMRMLVAFLIVGVGLFFALRLAAGAMGVRGLPATNLAFVIVLAVLFLLAQRWFVGAPMAGIGLRRYADWTRRERLYIFQVVPLAIAAFSIVFGAHLLALMELHGVAGFLLFSVLTGLLWGMVQEFLYRGWLQTELTRRFGALAGLLLANVAFTFGPLHLDYLLGAAGVRWGGLAAVFGIGLFFGIVYWRSGNLRIPAVLHGLWPPNMS